MARTTPLLPSYQTPGDPLKRMQNLRRNGFSAPHVAGTATALTNFCLRIKERHEIVTGAGCC
ncbi:hypothetical protein SCLCIDRAFT_1209497 [Scleroderma citrinum Foug A]|uniref:Uncharacterized protein n=1 Tax=Scleroderma citrinum Foug A TaxID=1036808 RepID=A0A0C3EIR5_9AGAM|nr:hypothetical protein SCLCIDRAFT_1209497 [Scleroderma citrinum Foug A]